MKRCALVVEDDDFIRMDAAEMFEAAGFEVVSAGNADEALALLESRDDVTTLFTDIEMPGSMDGLALATLARRRLPAMSIVVASGRPHPAPGTMPDRTVFVGKPYDWSTISAALAEAG